MIEFKIKQMFFDKPKVVSAMDDATRRSLSRAGAFVMRSARSSMRKPAMARQRKLRAEVQAGRRYVTLSPEEKRAYHGSSEPGKPPRVHAGTLRKMIYFGYDQRTRSVVVGPQRFSTKGGEAPRILEFGGKTVIVKRKRSGGRIRKRVEVKARPYMVPALEKNISVIPESFRGSVRGG